jgi:hypothetical protein
MKHIYTPIVLAAFLGIASQAFAGDQVGTNSHQQMKDCMARQKAENSSMSQADMKKACKAQMKTQASSTPNQTTPTTTGEPAPQSGSETNPPTSPPK